MLVSFNSRLVILAMPKCASTAIEAALAGHMDLVLRGYPGIKHMRARGYQRFIQPYLETLTDAPFEVVCSFREPEDWLHSWWRYRRREGMRKHENSTHGISFEQFVDLYLDGGQKPADVGRQATFISGPDRQIGVDRLFRYDRMDGLVRYLEERLSLKISLDRVNTSPAAPWLGSGLGRQRRAELREALARDYEIYETLAA